MERAHRTGKPDGGDRPRPIVVKLLRYKDIEAILQRAKSLRGTKIFINEDFTDTVRQKRKDLMAEAERCQTEGRHCLLTLRQIGCSSTNTPKQQ